MSTGPPPAYELYLQDRPVDREEFNAWVAQLLTLSRPERRWCFTRRARARNLECWRRMMRATAGRIYELGMGRKP